MKAVILAAGESKRLRPITNDMVKCMLEIDGRSIINYQIDNLKNASVFEVVVVTGFKGAELEEHLAASHDDVEFTFIRSKDYDRTYPAHGLWLAKKYFEDDCLYLNADVVSHPDIVKGIVDDPRGSVTAVQRNKWDEEEVNVILKNDSEEVTEMGKYIARSLSDGEFMGVTKILKPFGKELVKVLDEYIEREEFKKFAADALNLTIQRGQKMYALDVSHLPAIEIDTKEDLECAHEKLEEIRASGTSI